MTVWTQQSSQSTQWTPEVTPFLYDASGSYDGAELSTTDPDFLYDGHVGTAPLPATWAKATINSTSWT